MMPAMMPTMIFAMMDMVMVEKIFRMTPAMMPAKMVDMMDTVTVCLR